MNDVNMEKKCSKAFTYATMNLSMSLLRLILLTAPRNRLRVTKFYYFIETADGTTDSRPEMILSWMMFAGIYFDTQ